MKRLSFVIFLAIQVAFVLSGGPTEEPSSPDLPLSSSASLVTEAAGRIYFKNYNYAPKN